jgi:hypothetical protein
MDYRDILCCVVSLFLVSCLAAGQEQETPVIHPNQEVRVNNLPVRTAQSSDATAVLVAALETVVDSLRERALKLSGCRAFLLY